VMRIRPTNVEDGGQYRVGRSCAQQAGELGRMHVSL
jgi:hypothetical protein